MNASLFCTTRCIVEMCFRNTPTDYVLSPQGCHAPHLPFGTSLISHTDGIGKDLPLTTVVAASSLGLDP